MKGTNTMYKRSIIIITILGLSLLPSGCGNKKKVAQLEKTKVMVSTLKPQIAINTQEYPGVLSAANKMHVNAQTGGILKKVYVELGDTVVKGQKLGLMDTTIDEGRYMQAKAGYDLAKASYQRQSALYKENVISQQQYDTSLAQYRQAEGAYKQVQKLYNDCVLSAPLSGSVAFAYYDVGDDVPPNKPVFVVVNHKIIHMTVGVPDSDIAKIKKGKKVVVNVDSLPGKTFTGTVIGVGIMADEQSGAYPVKIAIPNPQGLIKAGMFGRAKIALDYYAKAKVVELDSLIMKGEDKGLFVVTSTNTVQFSPLTVNFEFGEKAMLKTALPFGTTYVISGQELLVDGETVTIVTENKN